MVGLGVGRGVRVDVGVGEGGAVGTGVRVGTGARVSVAVAVGEGSGVFVAPMFTGIVTIIVVVRVGVGVTFPPILDHVRAAIRVPVTPNATSPISSQAGTNIRRRAGIGCAIADVPAVGPVAPGKKGIFWVAFQDEEAGIGCQAGTGSLSARAISAAFGQRNPRFSSIAFRTACSVLGLMREFQFRGGRNCSGSAIRSVAVGGACPVSEWYSVAPRL